MTEKLLFNEKDLLLQVAQHDENAFRQLFEHYKNKIYAFAFHLTDSTVLSEEIVQDVFVKIWINKEALVRIDQFSAYLFTITRNHTFNQLKRLANERFILKQLKDELPESENNTEQLLINKEYNGILQQAIELLPPQQQLIYNLSRKEGLKLEEIAQQLNLSVNTVKSHMGKALKTIRSHFNDRIQTLLIIAAAFFLKD